MKLSFSQTGWPWPPERFRFAAEQMLLTLFPGERPESPPGPQTERAAEDSAVVFSLRREEGCAWVDALVIRPEGERRASSGFPPEKLDEPEEQVYHTVSHALKQAFYQAGTALLGHELPWGSLTGVRPVKLPTRAMLAGKTAGEAERELRQVYQVSPPRAALAVECAQAALDVRKGLDGDSLALYLGVPFCPTRCAYCSFISADVKEIGRAHV